MHHPFRLPQYNWYEGPPTVKSPVPSQCIQIEKTVPTTNQKQAVDSNSNNSPMDDNDMQRLDQVTPSSRSNTWYPTAIEGERRESSDYGSSCADDEYLHVPVNEPIQHYSIIRDGAKDSKHTTTTKTGRENPATFAASMVKKALSDATSRLFPSTAQEIKQDTNDFTV